jgi:hypothetical protein
MASDPVQSTPNVDEAEDETNKENVEETTTTVNSPEQKKNGFLQKITSPFKKLELDFITILLMVK